MKRILVVDTSAILHIIKHGEIKKVKSSFKDVYIIYGFLLRLRFYINRIRPNIIVFAMDDFTNNLHRKKIYPEYKANRSTKPRTKEQLELDQIAFPQFKAIEDSVLSDIGFSNVIRLPGYEADDVIGSVCKNYKGNEIVIISSDSDLYQLISPTICILNPRNDKYYTITDFRKEFQNLEPKMYKRIKVMSGCATDNVKGLPGVGTKTAIKFIKGELAHKSKAYKVFTSEEGQKIINRNKSLIILPFRGTPTIELKQLNSISKDKLEKVAKQYNFTAMYNDLDTWVKDLKRW